jgi:arylsulfatase A-like enzyme
MVDFRCSPLVETFNKAGYLTAFFGSPLFTYDNLSSASFVKKYSVFKDFNSMKKKYGDDGKLYSYQIQDSDTAGEAFEFMDETAKSRNRFFTFVFLYATHYPYSSPLSKNEKRGSVESYRLTQAYLSSVIEDLMKKMDSASILQNTAVIITSDHGEAFGKRKGVYGHGHSLYEESIKIPLLIYLPGLKKGTVSNKSGTHVDLAPTVAAIAGLEPEEDWQGINLLDEESSSAPSFIYTRSSTKLNGVIDGNYKYIYNVTDKTEQLFDLDADPDELKNIAKEKTEESSYYKDLVRNWAAYQQKWITSAGRRY